MSKKPRVSPTNRVVARNVSRGVKIGARFAFIDGESIDFIKHPFDPELHPSIASGKPGRMTIPLSSLHRTKLPGIAFRAQGDPGLCLQSLTVDRDLYRHLCDTVHVLVLDLDHADSAVTLSLQCDGIEVDQQTVSLDDQGVGMARFYELPTGHYEVNRTGDSVGDPCVFQVAAFELAQLSATIEQLKLDGNSLAVKFEIARFGKPVDAAVRIDLFDQDHRIDSRPIRVHDGLALASFELEGEGPHHFEIHLKKHADATATIPVPGSKRSDRDATILSQCGIIHTASLLPGTDSVLAQGLYVDQAETTNSPIRVTHLLRDQVRLEAMTDVEDCCIVSRRFVNPDTCGVSKGGDGGSPHAETFKRLGRLQAGQIVEIEVPRHCGLISVGGFVDGVAWEDCFVTITSSPSKTQVHVRPNNGTHDLNAGELDDSDRHDCFAAGSTVTIELDANALVDGTAWVVVRDARLQSSELPEQKLARCVKKSAEDANAGEATITEAYPSVTDHPYQNLFVTASPPVDEDVLGLLVESRILTEEQVDDVLDAAHQSGGEIFQRIIERGYAEPNAVCRAIAYFYKVEFVDIDEMDIADSILELCPESVARENSVIPLREEDGVLTFAVVNPLDLETIEKLRFILNRRIETVVSSPDSIREAINFFYGQIEGESADSMLQEFTDTAIDFSESGFDLTSTLYSVAVGGGVAGDAEDVAEKANAAAEGSERDDLNVLLCTIVPIRNGTASIEVTLPDDPNRYTVDAIVVADRGWSQAQHSFESDSDPYVKLLVPESLYENDQAIGRVVARCQSGGMKLSVTRDGERVELFNAAGETRFDPETTDEPELEATFVVGVGEFQAEVTDLLTMRSVTATRVVHPLGKLVATRRTMRLLARGETVRLDHEIKRIRPLPSPEPIHAMVAEATSDYQHLCCEQTAAKIFASVAYLAGVLHSPDLAKRQRGEAKALQAIRTGLRQQKELWLPGRGFAFYRGRDPDTTWGTMATRHLLKIEFLEDVVSTSQEGTRLLHDIRSLARKSAEHYRIAWPPRAVGDIHDAYAVTIHDQRTDSEAVTMALQMAAKQIQSATSNNSQVRCQTALAIACLLRRGAPDQVASGLNAANQILDCVGPEGRLYSTFDSIALLVMLTELSKRKLFDSDAHLVVNDAETTISEMLRSDVEIRSVTNLADALPVETICWSSEDWSQFDNRAGVSVSMKQGDQTSTSWQESDRVDVCVSIRKGYESGDLIWFALPPCLSRLDGGGQLKQFAIDPQGESQIRVRMAATSKSYHASRSRMAQHFMVCLRNMFDEERTGNPGPLPIFVD